VNLQIPKGYRGFWSEIVIELFSRDSKKSQFLLALDFTLSLVLPLVFKGQASVFGLGLVLSEMSYWHFHGEEMDDTFAGR
jgi:hypothetical protein